MMTTTKLLDAAKAASGCTTDYQFAKKFGLLLATVSRWRTGKGTFDDDHAAMIAEILGREPGEVMALCAAERAKTEAGRSRWLRVAALLAAVVAPPATGCQLDNNTGKGSLIRNTQCQLSALRRYLIWPAVRLA
jgi:transcriptional regulator with XRE-family HTH domain